MICGKSEFLALVFCFFFFPFHNFVFLVCGMERVQGTFLDVKSVTGVECAVDGFTNRSNTNGGRRLLL